jgi:hypothetical protein
MPPPPIHVVLLGDSIFDNGAYVPGQPDVVRQLRQSLPSGSEASLVAVDGAVTRQVAGQLDRLPAGATHLVVSSGGNDALGEAHLLRQACSTIGLGIGVLATAKERFAAEYDNMLDKVLAKSLPTALCTIYDANFPGQEGVVIRAALCLFNDAITRAAFSRGLPLIDLRLICSEPSDYANPIEPSAAGGEKIARAIGVLVSAQLHGPSVVIAG